VSEICTYNRHTLEKERKREREREREREQWIEMLGHEREIDES
jgi:hypothetical protein